MNPDLTRILVADGNDFADAVSASGVSGRADAVVVLTAGNKVPAATKSFLDGAQMGRAVSAVGGKSAAALKSLGFVEGITFTSYVGADRYATSDLVATGLGTGAKNVVLATGAVFPDSLVGGALANERDGVVLLVRKTVVPAGAAEFLRANKPTRVTLLGGTASISESVKAQVEQLIK